MPDYCRTLDVVSGWQIVVLQCFEAKKTFPIFNLSHRYV